MLKVGAELRLIHVYFISSPTLRRSELFIDQSFRYYSSSSSFRMHWHLWVAFAFATAAVAAYRWLRKFSFRLDFPVVGSPGDQDLANAVIEGHRKVGRG